MSNNDDNDGWGDLLAMAAGDVPSSNTNNVSPIHVMVKKKKETKKRKRGSNNNGDFQKMLDSRMSLIDSVAPSDMDSSKEWYLSVYNALVKIRISALSGAMSLSEPLDKKSTKLLSRISFPSYLDLPEVELLQRKQKHLVDCCNKQSRKSLLSFDQFVRVIMACDDLYLRIYYLQVSGALQSNTSSYLPHPISYFGNSSSSVAGDAATTRIREKLIQACEKYPELLLYHGLDGESNEDEDDDEYHHVLSKIHKQRFLESHLLFGSRYLDNDDDNIVGKETLKQLNRAPPQLSFYEHHETPATPLLQEWRDSCRDVLCNLYCYATLSPHTIRMLTRTVLKQEGITSIVELGAGTGYLANVLQKHSNNNVTVQAYDIDPTDNALNDYHGRTRPFVEVKQGDCSSVFAGTSTATTALMLCYPPPQSSMAYDAVKALITNTSKDDHAARYLIHVGEFKGLTGSNSLEELLCAKFDCIFSDPCLTWGTDCSYVTVWKTRHNNDNTRNTITTASLLLLPCMACRDKEATKRCRLLRHAVYCSAECFAQHNKTASFSTLCRLSLVPCSIQLDFDNELHFSSLDGYTATTRKKRKR